MTSEFVKSHDGDTAAILGEVRRLQLSRGFDATKRCKILFQSIVEVDQPPEFVKTLSKYGHLFQVGSMSHL
jgi:hypothetical protein